MAPMFSHPLSAIIHRVYKAYDEMNALTSNDFENVITHI